MAELTGEQRRAVHATGRTVAVVAGAGTGKTHVLTERYVHLVLERGAAVPRILAVTFTEKAAREMKDRIRRRLRDASRADLARAAEFAPVSTIHAFLARMLRERALDAGLDPQFAVADEITADFLREEALAETIDALPPEVRAALVDLSGAEAELLYLYEAARAAPLELRDLRPSAPDIEGLRARMAWFLEACAAADASAKGTARKLEGLAAGRRRFLALDPEAADEFRDLVKGNVAAAQRELFAEGKAIAEAYGPLRHAERAEATAAAVVETLARLDEAYTARKRAEGLLDFSDLEREGLRLLRSPAGAAVAADFDHLLVDEYQDTNRLQEAILDRLAASCERFGVGDEKQSIYRFRHADAGVFQDLQARSETCPLGGSFRSRPELIGFTNELFGELFAGTGVAPQDLRAEASWRPKEQPCVELLAPEADGAEAGRRLEARAVARRLRGIVEGKELRCTRADRPDEPLRYGDCALLVRVTSNLPIYERAFADAGVPYVVIQGRGYYAAREVVDLAHLLLLLADPRDGYRAVAVMTSLLCGVPDSDLLQLPGDAPWPLRALGRERPAAIPPERWERLLRFAGRFAGWRELAHRVDAGDLVEAILAETRFAELMLLEPDGRRRHANLMKVLRRARQTTEDYATFARSLLEFRERELRESEAPIAAETDDAVRIMTIHAAKGLEFPVVAIADLNWQPGGRSGPLFRARDGAFSFRLRDEDGGVEPPGFAELKAWNQAEDQAEEKRLLYVAFTRAQEHLLLSGARTPSRREGLVARLLSGFDGVRVLDAAPLVAPDAGRARRTAVRAALRRRAPLPRSVERDEPAARELLDRLDALEPPATDSRPYVAAVADLVEFNRCPRRYRLCRMLGIEYEAPAEGEEAADAEEFPRRALGTAFHELMKDVGPGAAPDDAAIRRHLPAAGEEDVSRVRAWCAWLREQDIVKELAGRKCQPEMPFLTRIHGLPVRGVIDLYEPTLPRLLDWKTGDQVRAAEYAPQVAIYLAALRALELPAPECAQLVYVAARRVVDVREEPVEPLIERFLAAHRGEGSFPPEPGPACLHCEFRAACAANGVAVPAP